MQAKYSRLLLLTTILFSLFTVPVFAADDATVEKLSRMIEQQQKMLETQSRELANMRNELNTIRATQKATPVAAAAPAPPPSASEKPKEYVEVGSFPGSMKIPGTNASIKIGGQVKVDALYTPKQTPGLSEDVFFTRTIQSGNTTQSPRSRVMARDTRLNFDVRSSTELGDLRAFTEFDLFGASSAGFPQSQLNGYDVRLRHAYIQLGQWMVGQNWSTFNDPASFAETLDFGQVNGEAFTRQPQIRWTSKPTNGVNFAVAAENPEGDISDNIAPNVARRTTADTLPDMIANVQMEKEWGRLQAGALYRRIKLEGDTISPAFSDTANGYGVNLSGKIKTPWIGEKDTLRFQANYGDGIGRYINDLQAVGTETYDAVVNASNTEIETLKAFGGYTSYQAVFNDKWRSNLIGGYVHVKQPDYQPLNALVSTTYVAANVIWTPVPKLDIGTEFLYGQRENVSGESGNATRIIASVRYMF